VTTFVLVAPRCGNRQRGFRFMTSGEEPVGHRHRRRHRRGELGFGPGGPRFGGRRAGRGDIRAAVLALLAEQPMHGYQIIQELHDRTQGAWRPSPGSVYPTLQQLADEELVRETTSKTGKRVYEPTDAGRELAAAAPAPWEALLAADDDPLVALRDLVGQVGAATRQVASAGTQEQLAAAQEILRDARKQLYRLLADA
jgi:DNA-binding PadR family transcriptional regulator